MFVFAEWRFAARFITHLIPLKLHSKQKLDSSNNRWSRLFWSMWRLALTKCLLPLKLSVNPSWDFSHRNKVSVETLVCVPPELLNAKQRMTSPPLQRAWIIFLEACSVFLCNKQAVFFSLLLFFCECQARWAAKVSGELDLMLKLSPWIPDRDLYLGNRPSQRCRRTCSMWLHHNFHINSLRSLCDCCQQNLHTQQWPSADELTLQYKRKHAILPDASSRIGSARTDRGHTLRPLQFHQDISSSCLWRLKRIFSRGHRDMFKGYNLIVFLSVPKHKQTLNTTFNTTEN